MMRLLAFTLIALGLFTAPASAAGIALTPAKSGAFPERSYLLTLPARASLAPSQVSISENGAAVGGLSVLPTNAVGQSHFGTVLEIETSQSMRGSAIESALAAARSFVKQRNPQQPLGVVEFDSQPHVALPLSTDQTAIGNVLTSAPTLAAGTHIFSAVSSGLQMLAQANVTAGSIIMLSDGALTGRLSERASRQRKAQVISAAREQNVRVYAIGVHDSAFNSHTLQGLAASAGGTYTEVDSAGLSSLLRELGLELSDQYLVSYRSRASLGHNVQVVARVAGQPGVATASYTAPKLSAPVAARPSARRHTSFWSTTTSAALISVVCALLIGLGAMAALAPRRSVGRRVGAFVSDAPPEDTKSWTSTLLERAFAGERTGTRRGARWAKLVDELELGGIGASPEQVVVLTALATIVLGWLLVSATASPLAALLALGVPVAVRIALRMRVDRQRRVFDEQLPDNLQVVSAAMRAGHTFVGALAIVADDAPEPSRRELRRVLADEQLGVPLADALKSVTERMNSRDFEHVALVAALQRDTGGNTAEVIDTVAETIRERLDLRRLVRTLTAQGRLSAGIVSALPLVLLIAISLINPGYMHPLFHRAVGIVGLGIGAAMVVAGFLVMRRIVNIKI